MGAVLVCAERLLSTQGVQNCYWAFFIVTNPVFQILETSVSRCALLSLGGWNVPPTSVRQSWHLPYVSYMMNLVVKYSLLLLWA